MSRCHTVLIQIQVIAISVVAACAVEKHVVTPLETERHSAYCALIIMYPRATAAAAAGGMSFQI